MRELLASAEVDSVVLVHPYPDQMLHLINLVADGNPCLIPRRNRQAVRDSWIKYGKDLNNFAGLSLDYWYQAQAEIAERALTWYLDLDKPDIRDVQLADINIALNLNLKTDWTPVRQAGA